MKSFSEYVLSLGFRFATCFMQTHTYKSRTLEDWWWPIRYHQEATGRSSVLCDFSLTCYLLQGGSQEVAVLLVDSVPLQAGEHFQLFVGPQRQQVDDAVTEGTLGHGVVGKALADSVGWVDGRGALALGSDLQSRKRWFADVDLLSL